MTQAQTQQQTPQPQTQQTTTKKVKASDIFATIDEALAVANLPQEDYARIAKYEEDAAVLRSASWTESLVVMSWVCRS